MFNFSRKIVSLFLLLSSNIVAGGSLKRSNSFRYLPQHDLESDGTPRREYSMDQDAEFNNHEGNRLGKVCRKLLGCAGTAAKATAGHTAHAARVVGGHAAHGLGVAAHVAADMGKAGAAAAAHAAAEYGPKVAHFAADLGKKGLDLGIDASIAAGHLAAKYGKRGIVAGAHLGAKVGKAAFDYGLDAAKRGGVGLYERMVNGSPNQHPYGHYDPYGNYVNGQVYNHYASHGFNPYSQSRPRAASPTNVYGGNANPFGQQGNDPFYQQQQEQDNGYGQNHYGGHQRPSEGRGDSPRGSYSLGGGYTGNAGGGFSGSSHNSPYNGRGFKNGFKNGFNDDGMRPGQKQTFFRNFYNQGGGIRGGAYGNSGAGGMGGGGFSNTGFGHTGTGFGTGANYRQPGNAAGFGGRPSAYEKKSNMYADDPTFGKKPDFGKKSFRGGWFGKSYGRKKSFFGGKSFGRRSNKRNNFFGAKSFGAKNKGFGTGGGFGAGFPPNDNTRRNTGANAANVPPSSPKPDTAQWAGEEAEALKKVNALIAMAPTKKRRLKYMQLLRDYHPDKHPQSENPKWTHLTQLITGKGDAEKLADSL